jgi:hypothetical protein
MDGASSENSIISGPKKANEKGMVEKMEFRFRNENARTALASYEIVMHVSSSAWKDISRAKLRKNMSILLCTIRHH